MHRAHRVEVLRSDRCVGEGNEPNRWLPGIRGRLVRIGILEDGVDIFEKRATEDAVTTVNGAR